MNVDENCPLAAVSGHLKCNIKDKCTQNKCELNTQEVSLEIRVVFCLDQFLLSKSSGCFSSKSCWIVTKNVEET